MEREQEGALAPPGTTPHTAVMALSVRQPWASLIVHGIRTLETRGFVPSYRGYIWIHATSAEPEVDMIIDVQDFYKRLHESEGRNIRLPRSYPTGCLVGCVRLVAVLDRQSFDNWPNLPRSITSDAGNSNLNVWLLQDPYFFPGRDFRIRIHAARKRLFAIDPVAAAAAAARLRPPNDKWVRGTPLVQFTSIPNMPRQARADGEPDDEDHSHDGEIKDPLRRARFIVSQDVTVLTSLAHGDSLPEGAEPMPSRPSFVFNLGHAGPRVPDGITKRAVADLKPLLHKFPSLGSNLEEFTHKVGIAGDRDDQQRRGWVQEVARMTPEERRDRLLQLQRLAAAERDPRVKEVLLVQARQVKMVIQMQNEGGVRLTEDVISKIMAGVGRMDDQPVPGTPLGSVFSSTSEMHRGEGVLGSRVSHLRVANVVASQRRMGPPPDEPHASAPHSASKTRWDAMVQEVKQREELRASSTLLSSPAVDSGQAPKHSIRAIIRSVSAVMSETRSATSEPATALATAPDAGLPSVRSSTRLDTLTSAQAGHKLQDLCPPPETIRVSAAVKLPEIGRQNLTGASSSLFDARDETPLGARSAGSASPEPGAGVWPWGGDGDFGHAWQESGPLLPGLYERRLREVFHAHRHHSMPEEVQDVLLSEPREEAEERETSAMRSSRRGAASARSWHSLSGVRRAAGDRSPRAEAEQFLAEGPWGPRALRSPRMRQFADRLVEAFKAASPERRRPGRSAKDARLVYGEGWQGRNLTADGPSTGRAPKLRNL